MTQPLHPQKNCPGGPGKCKHPLVGHHPKAGCMHRRPNGAICGCSWVPPEIHSANPTGANPFGVIGAFAAPTPSPKATPATTNEGEHTTMTDQLWNIAGVAAEIGVTPQAASAFHRGPEATPAADFKVVNTGLELWNVDSIEAWHEWLEARNKVAAEAKAAKAAPKQSAPKVPETPDETDTSHLTDEQIGDLGQPGDLETPDGLQEFAEVAESDEPNAFEQATSRKGRKTQQAGAA